MIRKFLYFILSLMVGCTAGMAQNLLPNGGFEEGFEKWIHLAGDGGAATFSLDSTQATEGTKALKVDISTLGANFWSIQSINYPWASETGKTYTLRFYAKADVAGTRLRVVQQVNSYDSREFTLTTQWKQYEWTFTAQEDHLQLRLNFPQTGTVYVDGLIIPPAVNVTTQNLIANPSFESDFSKWFTQVADGANAHFSISTTDHTEGSKSLKLEATTPGPNPWSIQAVSDAWKSKAGETYTVSFYAKAKPGSGTFKAVQQNSSYAERIITPTPEWTQYVWTFQAAEEFLQLKFHFPNAGTYYIDQIYLPGQAPAEEIDSINTLAIDPAQTYQKMEGFGASTAFFTNWLPSHPYKAELYNLLFKDLGLDILRFRNVYQHDDGFAEIGAYRDILQAAETSVGRPVKVLLSSWTPPSALKKDGIANGGTLAKNAQGFVYQEFAQYWADAIAAYRAIGVNPTYISIQNEPDFETNQWETCVFKPEESADYPSYGKALDAVYAKLSSLSNRPQLIGPEATGIIRGIPGSYAPHINKDHLDGYAFHLYSGGSSQSPDTFNPNLKSLVEDFGDKPRLMTEYAATEFGDNDWFTVAWLMNNALTEAHLSAYLYWDLFWGNDHKENAGLISLENPWNPDRWKYAKGYVIHPYYYAFKHFSAHIHAGYQNISGKSTNQGVRSSAFLSPDRRQMVVVLINTATNAVTSTVAPAANWQVQGSTVYQSVDSSFYQPLGSLQEGGKIPLPPRSVTTVVLRVLGPNVAPVAQFAATPQTGFAPLPVSVDASASTDIEGDSLTYAWNFGDGSTGMGLKTNHLYTRPGVYTATLTVTDVRGGVGTATQTITIKPGLKLQYMVRAGENNPTDNHIRPFFRIVNIGDKAVPYNELSIRYWYTREHTGTLGQQFWCDYASMGKSAIKGKFVAAPLAGDSADTYVEVRIASATSLAPGKHSGEIQTRFNNANWSAYVEPNDFSYKPSLTNYTDWTHVTLYRNNELIWGTEPSSIGTSRAKVSYEEVVVSDELKVFPNPSVQGQVALSLPYTTDHPMLEIVDVKGRQVYTQPVTESTVRLQRSLSPGLYLIRVHYTDKTLVQKLVIQ